MSGRPRELLADSPAGRVELTQGGHFYVYNGPVALCMDRETFEEFVTTLALAAVRFRRHHSRAKLHVVPSGDQA